MTLSPNILNEIAYLYESIYISEQEDLHEVGSPGAAFAAQQAAQQKAQASSAKSALQSGKMLGIGGAPFGTQTGTSVKLNSADTKAQGRTVLDTARVSPRGGPLQKGVAGPADNKITLGGQNLYRAQLGGRDVYVGAKPAAGAPPRPGQPPAGAPPRPGQPPAGAPPRPGQPPAGAPPRPGQPPAGAPPRPQPPAGAPSPKVAPTTPAGPTKPAGSAMDQWAKANPTLAAAAAEKARIRGTSETDNPLMKDMRSSLPAPTSSQSPAVAKLGPGNQSLVNNPNVPKPVTASQAVSATTKPDTGITGAQSKLSAAKKPITPNPSASSLSSPDSLGEGVDLFDYILEHLVAEGYADTNEAALAIMANMSEEWREEIVEAATDQSDQQIERGIKTTYKAGNVLDNQHQGRSRGLSRLSPREREAKTERMRKRLKTRRDDLFGERNRREDEARAEMRKKYGL